LRARGGEDRAGLLEARPAGAVQPTERGGKTRARRRRSRRRRRGGGHGQSAGSGQPTTSEPAHHVRKELADSRGRLGKREKERARRWAEHGSAAPSRWRGEAAGN
jgi:hypothetical protein